MTDTPRTDAELYTVVIANENGGFGTEQWVKPDFARQLERELAETKRLVEAGLREAKEIINNIRAAEGKS
jgi:hypothetical protein